MMEEIKAMRGRGETPFLLSTGSLIGEGFDLPELCTLVLAMPVSFKGRLVQYAGRLHRESAEKMMFGSTITSTLTWTSVSPCSEKG